MYRLLSRVINEAESIPELSEWIEKVMKENNYSYEVIYVDDGSTDTTWKVVEEQSRKNPNFKGIKFQRNYGKSAGLNEGFRSAQGDVIITMDGDLQDSPDEIPELRRLLLEGDYDIVSGWKKKRYDNTLTKNIPSKFFNWVTRRVSKIQLHDFNCGLKAYRNKPGDVAAVRAVELAAFTGPEEADIVDRIRDEAPEGWLSLVAVAGNTVVGHLLTVAVPGRGRRRVPRSRR